MLNLADASRAPWPVGSPGILSVVDTPRVGPPQVVLQAWCAAITHARPQQRRRSIQPNHHPPMRIRVRLLPLTRRLRPHDKKEPEDRRPVISVSSKGSIFLEPFENYTFFQHLKRISPDEYQTVLPWLKNRSQILAVRTTVFFMLVIVRKGGACQTHLMGTRTQSVPVPVIQRHTGFSEEYR